jgi:hypothetical protein
MPAKSMTSLVLCAVALLAVTLTGCVPEAKEVAPANRIVVLIDGSGTFKQRRSEAVERAAELIDSVAQAQRRRFEGLQDTVAVIAIDAMPSVLWRGSLEDLRSADRRSWVRQFDARSDYAACTDIDTAFRLAAEELGASSSQVHKFAFVFSDLQHEPPGNDMDRCEPPRKGPGDTFPWDRLEDVAVSVLWAPRSQKLLWRRQIDERGMSATFKVYTDSESAEVVTAPPPAAKRIVTEPEKKQTQALLGTFLWGAAKLAALVTCVVVILPILVAGLGRLRRRRGAGRRAVAQGGRHLA